MLLRSLIAACLCLFCGWAAIADDASDLLLATEEWPPYNYTSNGQLTGFSTEIVQAIMAELGEEHAIRVYPGPRLHEMLDSSPNVMAFSYFRTPEREARYKWIGPLTREAVYFYKRKNDSRIFRDLDDIRAVQSVVVPHRGLIITELKRLGFRNYKKIPSNTDQINNVLRGQSDLLANFTPLGIAFYLRSLDEAPDALVPTGVKIIEFNLDIACSKDIPDDVIARWQAALDAVRESGIYDRVHDRYLH